MDSPGGNTNDSDKQRDRGRRGTRFSDANKSGDGGEIRDRSRDPKQNNSSSGGVNKRVYVSNIPYEYRWQDLKDLFRRMVGSVEYVELFLDESGKPRGCGIVEFKEAENVAKALQTMHRHELNGREIVVKEDFGEERDKYGRIARGSGGASGGNDSRGGGGRNNQGGGSGGGGLGRDNDRYMSIGGGTGGASNGLLNNSFNQQDTSFNTYGLSPSFLANLGIQGPLHNKVFVANLDYKVDTKKLKQVFKMAGRVISVDLSKDKDGNSRGFAVVEYDHPVEAVQAISMFDHQMLYDRRMTVRLDRIPEKEKLPEGLGGIGMGLGPGGEPLRNVALNLPSLQNDNKTGTNSNLSNNAPGPVQAPSSLSAGVLSAANTNAMAALTNLTNLSNLNPLLSTLSSLAATGGGDTGGDSNNASGLLSKMVGSGGTGVGSLGSGNVGSSTGVSSTYNSLSGRLDSTPLSSQYSSSGYGNLSSALSGGLGGGNNTYSSTQRSSDYDLSSSVRGYNSNNDDYSRLSSLQNFSSSQLGNGTGTTNSNSGTIRSQNISDTILIRNLPSNCTWQTLRDKFRDIGEVKFAEIRGSDCGIVRFSKERDAELAIKLKDGSRFDGRTVDVTFF